MMEITCELSENDLDFFRKVMLKARERMAGLDDAAVIENARGLLHRVTHSETSDFIRKRMGRLGQQAMQLERSDWLEERRQQLHSRMRRRRHHGGGGHSPFSLF